MRFVKTARFYLRYYILKLLDLSYRRDDVDRNEPHFGRGQGEDFSSRHWIKPHRFTLHHVDKPMRFVSAVRFYPRLLHSQVARSLLSSR